MAWGQLEMLRGAHLKRWAHAVDRVEGSTLAGERHAFSNGVTPAKFAAVRCSRKVDFNEAQASRRARPPIAGARDGWRACLHYRPRLRTEPRAKEGVGEVPDGDA